MSLVLGLILSALGGIADHLSHLLYALQSVLLQVEDDGVHVLEAVVAVQAPALCRRLKIAVEARLLLLLKSPFDEQTPSTLPSVLLCRDEERED